MKRISVNQVKYDYLYVEFLEKLRKIEYFKFPMICLLLNNLLQLSTEVKGFKVDEVVKVIRDEMVPVIKEKCQIEFEKFLNEEQVKEMRIHYNS